MSKTRRRQIGIPLFVLFALFAAADLGSAQTMDERPGGVVVNESNQEVRVYAFPQNVDDRVLLGWVGGAELDYFPVPAEARTSQGTFRMAVQQITPLPQIGISATPHPLNVTPTIDAGVDGTARVVLDRNFEMTTTIVP